MSGGLFVNRPFSFNLKCIIFGFALLIGYWAAAGPRVNFWLFPLIFIFAYVAMAWYDELYSCSDRLRSGRYGIMSMTDSIFKPQLTDEQSERPKVAGGQSPHAADDQSYLYKRNMHMFHAFIAMPLFMYVTYGRGGSAALAFGFAFLGFAYHLFALFAMWSS
ncbi:hypothetical protein [carnivorous sponge associated iridovirus]|jgi:hypothetical protein|nr:hypothetical protein [carnivorous sponge associated iridovirus]